MKDQPRSVALPTMRDLPKVLRGDGAIGVEIEEGVLILRVSKAVQNRIESLLRKQRTAKRTSDEENELNQYEDVDDYLSFLNRLSRNLIQSQHSEEVAGAP